MTREVEDAITTEPLVLPKLRKDIKEGSKTLGEAEARFLVDLYYSMQGTRIAASNEANALAKSNEPHATVAWLTGQAGTLENQVKSVLDVYSQAHPLGRWARAQTGIGPVIAAGLLAHINIARAQTAGAVWAFAGLNADAEWLGKEKAADAVKEALEANGGDLAMCIPALAKRTGMRAETLLRLATTKPDGTAIKLTKESLTRAAAKRPWNASLKTLCWKIGESFVKFSSHEGCWYGQMYSIRKAQEIERNKSGRFKEQAERSLATKNWRRDTKTKASYEAGLLPDARIHLRAQRYAVKLFLAHFWEQGRRLAGLPIPAPYPIAHLGHAHVIEPPPIVD